MIQWHYGQILQNDSGAFHLKGNGPARSLDRFGFWTGKTSNFLENDTVHEVIRIAQKHFYPHAKLREGGMKGTWFLSAPGSGIFIDMGKTIQLNSRHEFVKRFALPIALPKSYPFALDYTNLTCVTAQKYGYDTVQFKMRPMLEIVNCRKSLTNMKQHLDDACARPLPLWKDARKRETCKCNNNYPILNCRASEAKPPITPYL